MGLEKIFEQLSSDETRANLIHKLIDEGRTDEIPRAIAIKLVDSSLKKARDLSPCEDYLYTSYINDALFIAKELKMTLQVITILEINRKYLEAARYAKENGLDEEAKRLYFIEIERLNGIKYEASDFSEISRYEDNWTEQCDEVTKANKNKVIKTIEIAKEAGMHPSVMVNIYEKAEHYLEAARLQKEIGGMESAERLYRKILTGRIVGAECIYGNSQGVPTSLEIAAEAGFKHDMAKIRNEMMLFQEKHGSYSLALENAKILGQTEKIELYERLISARLSLPTRSF